MKPYPQRHSLTRMHDGRLLGVTEDGTWWLWDYDANVPELAVMPATRQGRWATIDTSHRLYAMTDGRVLDWTPVDGRWRLWEYRPNEPDILTGPNAQGRWSTIGPGHELVPLPDGTVLDWSQQDDSWRLWSYDPGDPDPGRVQQRRRLPGQPWDILTGPVAQGSWRVTHPMPQVRVPAGHHLVPLPDGAVLDWAPDGRWCTWAAGALFAPARDQVIDGQEPVPVRSGQWGSIREGHVLIPTADGNVIDWMPLTGDFWLWAYDFAQQKLAEGAPLASGVWRSLNELPDRLQFRLRYMLEHESTDSLLQGANDEVYLQAIGLDSAMVTRGPDGGPVAETIASPVLGDISDDAVRDPWRTHPQVLVDFDIHRPADWPRTFTVTLLIVEEDNDALRDTFDALEKKVGKEVEAAAVTAASTAVGAAVGSAIIPGVGTAVGAAVGALVGAGYDLIVEEIRSGLGNEVFTPVSRTFTVDDPRTMWLHPDVNRPQVIRVEQYGAVYDLEVDWVWA